MGFHQQKLSGPGCALGLIAVLLAFAWGAGAAYSPAQVGKVSPEDTPVSPSIQDRLSPPPMGNPPTQVDQGHFVYYQVCIACHGDHGQGLTGEWRAQFGSKDMNCWQSKCHSFNHPP